MRYVSIVIVLAAACQERPDRRAACECRPIELPPEVMRHSSGPSGSRWSSGRMNVVEKVKAWKRRVERPVPGVDHAAIYKENLIQAVLTMCFPCVHWVPKTGRIEDFFPLEQLPRAVGARCLGFVLDDAAVAYASARPPECRE